MPYISLRFACTGIIEESLFYLKENYSLLLHSFPIQILESLKSFCMRSITSTSSIALAIG